MNPNYFQVHDIPTPRPALWWEDDQEFQHNLAELEKLIKEMSAPKVQAPPMEELDDDEFFKELE